MDAMSGGENGEQDHQMLRPPPRIHLVGRQNQGKTTLMLELVEHLSGRGLRVGTVKHSGHDHPVDMPGKDSFRHRQAGGSPAALITTDGIGIFLPRGASPYRDLAPLYRRCDLVLVEGDLSAEGAVKVEVFRAGEGHAAPLAVGRADIAAVISDDPLPGGLVRWPRHAPGSLARRLLDLAPPRRAVRAFILAGGRSQRFGSDKALARPDGRTMLQATWDLAAAPLLSLGATAIARRAGQYDHLGLPSVGDDTPDLGPMGGLITALRRLPDDQEWALLLPCDLWGMRAEWLEQLLGASRRGCRAMAFRGDRWQPLPAMYHRDLLPTCEDLLRDGRASLWHLLEAAGARALPLPDGWEDAVQLNSPDDLARIRER